MDGDFGEKLNRVLNDPEALSKIMQIASGMGGAPPAAPSPAPETVPVKEAVETAARPALPMQLPKPDGRLALLNSLRPLLREDKRKKLDSLRSAMTVATLLSGYKKSK